MTLDPTARRYDLDWLRIIAFGLLILYHVGMFYVTWGWHVKSVYASTFAEPLMRLVNPWRLALLFFISGVAIRFATDKAESLGRFALSRLARLGLPLLFGIYAWVMLQAYYQVRQSGEFAGSIFAFYPDYVALEQTFSTITPTWNHLWYLAYVLVYILVALAVLPWLRRFAESRAWQSLTRRPLVVAFVLILPFVVNETWLSPIYPTTHDLINDWANHAHRFMIFLVGFFVAKDAAFWRSVDKVWKFGPVMAIAAWLVLQNGEDIANWLREFLSATQLRFLFSYIAIIYAWSCILTLLGFGQRFLNRESPQLRYLTAAIFCFYVLHQTITIVAGYYLTEYQFGVVVESVLVLVITVAGCVLGYELIRRIPGIGILFGVHKVSGFHSGR
ncbi:MAG: acyltransferase family protein [Gammaproteobacteria bacterium]|nr:acyltransferase family protein [Gammaproteobacteria bacterium]